MSLKKLTCVMGLIVCIAILYLAVVVRASMSYSSTPPYKQQYTKASAEFGDLTDDASSETFYFSGFVKKVQFMITGTDDALTVSVTDEEGYEFLSLTSLTADVAYVPEYESTSGNAYGGFPVDGTCTVTITNADGLSACEVVIIGD